MARLHPWSLLVSETDDYEPVLGTELVYFTREEFKCSCCGSEEMEDDFLFLLDELRDRCGFPFSVTSGYRCRNHPQEARKVNPGTHNKGIAADIKVYDGVQRHKIVTEAVKMGCFNGIGVADGFVHVDVRTTVPVLWTY